jgi:hypothetical protein
MLASGGSAAGLRDSHEDLQLPQGDAHKFYGLSRN